MFFGRKVYYEPRAGKLLGRHHKHLADPDFAALAGLLVGRKDARVLALELKRDPLAHDPDAVDGIDQCVDLGGEQIAFDTSNHC